MAAKKKIAVVVGSLRKGSYNRLAAKALMALAPADFDCEIVEIAHLGRARDTGKRRVERRHPRRRESIGDLDAVDDRLAARSGELPIYLIGHSLGAQLPGLLQHRDRLAGLLSVAAGSGYWRDNAPQLKRMVLYFWHVLVPVGTALFGYFPGKRIGKVGNLPKGEVAALGRFSIQPSTFGLGPDGAAYVADFGGGVVYRID